MTAWKYIFNDMVKKRISPRYPCGTPGHCKWHPQGAAAPRLGTTALDLLPQITIAASAWRRCGVSHSSATSASVERKRAGVTSWSSGCSSGEEKGEVKTQAGASKHGVWRELVHRIQAGRVAQSRKWKKYISRIAGLEQLAEVTSSAVWTRQENCEPRHIERHQNLRRKRNY